MPADNIGFARCGVEVILLNVLGKYTQKTFPFSNFCVILENGKSFCSVLLFFEFSSPKSPAPREAVFRWWQFYDRTNRTENLTKEQR